MRTEVFDDSRRRAPCARIEGLMQKSLDAVAVAMMIVTGSLLFISEPVKCYENISFRFKVLFLFVAAINILFFHSSNVYRKIGVANRTEAGRWAQMHGLLDADSPAPSDQLA